MLIAADKLKSKIIAADIESASEKDELSPAQQELAEEMGQMPRATGFAPAGLTPAFSAPVFPPNGMVGGSSAPQFSYVRTVAAEDVKKLVADAVADAKKNAQQLAESTGVKLGAIFRVASSSWDRANSLVRPYGYSQPTRSVVSYETGDDGTLYAVSALPKIEVSRTITFAFKIKAE